MDLSDPYYGPIDSTVVPMQPASSSASNPCPNGASTCYQPQWAYSQGSSFYFYNAGAVSTSKLQSKPTSPIPVSLVTNRVYTFPDAGCQGGTAFDPINDAYTQRQQYPVFGGLPDGGAPLPNLALVVPVSGTATSTCNDIKTAADMGTSSSPGNYNAVANPAQSPGVALWPVVDNAAQFAPNSSLFVAEQPGWYADLQLVSVNDGFVPQDGNGNLLYMDGVLIDPPTGFSQVTAAQAVILPFIPGQAGYSPIVRLWDYNLGPSETFGTYTDICHNTTPGGCTSNQINIDNLTASGKLPVYTIFILTSNA
jgi:hypothetical protein